MKTKKKTNALQEKDDAAIRAAAEMSDEALERVSGGFSPEENMPQNTESEWLNEQTKILENGSNLSKSDKTLLQSVLTARENAMTQLQKTETDLEKLITDLERRYPNL